MNLVTNTIVAAQSLWIRSATLFLPAAAGPNHGVVEAVGSPAFRLAVVGDSSAAGIGVSRHALGIAGGMARELAVSTGRRIEWLTLGRPSATLQRIRQYLIPELPVDQDLAVLVAGTSDALADRPLDEWSIDIGAAIEDLAVRHRRVLVAGLPPFAEFPCLPQPLAETLDERASAMDEVTSRVCESRHGVVFAPSRPFFPAETDGLFAVDGFHPSARAYAQWARLLTTAAAR